MRPIKDNRYTGKKILLICPSNNEYPKTIKSVLEERGAEVHYYDERGNPNTLEKLLYRKVPRILKKRIEKYYHDIITTEKDFNADIVLVICPEAITKESLTRLKKTFKDAFFIVYLWDAIVNKKIDKIFEEFDECYSFDHKDCKEYGFKFRPLFFSREYYRKNTVISQKFKYDFGFIGTLHSDRPRIINQIRKYCDEQGLSYYFYLYVQGKLPFIYWLLRSHDVRVLCKHNMIHMRTMARGKAEKKMEQTQCVVDINHPRQNGLTMRTIEMLGLQKKLLTTNGNILKYDFYNPRNQMIISERQIDFDRKWVRQPYIPIKETIYRKYTIDYWIDEILANAV